jgi:GINS complex subunit 4
MEIDRVTYLLTAYLRARLFKVVSSCIQYTVESLTVCCQIQSFPNHVLSSTANINRLSHQELKFAEKFVKLREQHFAKSALSQVLPPSMHTLPLTQCTVQLPAKFRGLSEQTREEDMIPSPDMDSFVFARALRDVGEVEMERSG